MSRHFPTDWVLTLHRPGRPLLCCFSASSASSTSSVSCAPGSAPGSASSQCDQCLVLVMDQRGGLAEKLPKERLWRGASNTFLFLLFEYYCRVSTMEVLTSLSTHPPPPRSPYPTSLLPPFFFSLSSLPPLAPSGWNPTINPVPVPQAILQRSFRQSRPTGAVKDWRGSMGGSLNW